MKNYPNIVLTFLLILQLVEVKSQDFNSTLETPLPTKISNNAVTGGVINGIPHVYSFSGIDSTKIYRGINLKAFRYNTVTKIWDTIPDLPDTRGKIAAGASTIDSIIYIIGGYHVDNRGNEVSSNKIHRYNINSNSYLADGTSLPIATDDHVQAVWNDSLIFVITGWSNTGNIPNVQIYNPTLDNWSNGTSIPNNNSFKSFGASGTIVGNTIYYYGGASSASGFNIQNILRIGKINPTNPMQISWSDTIIDPAISCYRSACVSSSRGINWLGGSEVTYNYNGIAYNGTGGVTATGKNIYFNPSDSTLTYKQIYGNSISMDLRGVADFGNTKYLVGGMINNQEVTYNLWKLSFLFVDNKPVKKEISFDVYPNPAEKELTIYTANNNLGIISILSSNGDLIYQTSINNKIQKINVSEISSGFYIVSIRTDKGIGYKKIIIQ